MDRGSTVRPPESHPGSRGCALRLEGIRARGFMTADMVLLTDNQDKGVACFVRPEQEVLFNKSHHTVIGFEGGTGVCSDNRRC